MSIFVIIIHILVSVALILIVLLQTGKGADIGAAFGGGSSQTLFGSGGASSFLSKLTTVAAVIFMLTSLVLAYMSGHRAPSSIMTDMVVPQTEQALPPIQPPVEGEAKQPESTLPQAAQPEPASGPAEK